MCSCQHPQDPVPPPPRRVPYAALSWGTRFLIPWGSSFFFGGIFFVVASFFVDRPIWDDWILDSRGVRTLARPVSVSDVDTAVNDLPVYEIELDFLDAAGRPRSSVVFVNDAAVIADARRRMPLSIDYDPRRTDRCRIAGQPASVTGALIVLPLVSVLIGVMALIPAIVSTRRTYRLYRNGTATHATVVAVTPTASTEGDSDSDIVMRADYVFSSHDGRATGSVKIVGPPPAGATLWIIYDPNDPSQNVAVPEKVIES